MRIALFTNAATRLPALADGVGAVAGFAYAAQCTDAESGFPYLWACYYDPSTAQFIGIARLYDTDLSEHPSTGFCGKNRSVSPLVLKIPTKATC